MSKLALPLILAVLLSSCSGAADGETPGPDAPEADAAPAWGDSPGIIAHTDDYRVLVTLAPQTGEELHRVDLGNGEGGLTLTDTSTKYGFFVYPILSFSGQAAFSEDFGYLATTQTDETIVVHRLSDRETIAEFDTVGDSISSTDARFIWMEFGPDGENLYFIQYGHPNQMYSVPFLEEGAEPTLVKDDVEYATLDNLIDGEPPLNPTEFTEKGDLGTDAFSVEGVQADNGFLLREVLIGANRNPDDPYEFDHRATYAHFTRTDSGEYIGFDLNSEDSRGTTHPGSIIEFSLNAEGGIAEWSTVLDEQGVDAYALSPQEDRIAVSKDGSVFLVSRDDPEDQVRLETDENEDYQLLGWT